MPSDWLIRYDAERRTLMLYPGECSADGLSLRVSPEVKPVEIRCDNALASDVIERKVGAAVLSTLTALNAKPAPVPIPATQTSGGEGERAAEAVPFPLLEEAAAAHDPCAQYLLALRLRERAIEQRSLVSLNRAELLLVAAANQGYPAARQLLTQWPAIRAAVHWHVESGIIHRT